jgi:hypothetical protein
MAHYRFQVLSMGISALMAVQPFSAARAQDRERIAPVMKPAGL